MKTILYLILGIILGIITIKLCVSVVVCICNLAIVSAAIYGVFAVGIGILTKKCFAKM